VTTTTHKTLRGPRGGMIICRKDFAKKVDSAIFPGIQGGPLMHIIAAKAVSFKEALTPEFKQYQKQIVANSKAFVEALTKKGYRIVSGGTDNHLFMVDLRSRNISGKDAATVLDHVNITVNKNLIPYDPEKATVTSGLRIGTPAVTTRGMKERDMGRIADLMDRAITARSDEAALSKIKAEVIVLMGEFPIYPKL
jgi:glycine hydroxymethyltransferase